MTARQQAPTRVRLAASVMALITSWTLNGAYWWLHFYGFWLGIPAHDRLRLTWDDTRFWLASTAFFCFVGWFAVGLPIALAGDKVLRRSVVLTTLLTGLAGAALLMPLTLPWASLGGSWRTLLEPFAWVFPGIAFLFGAVTMLFYRGFVWILSDCGWRFKLLQPAQKP